MGNEPEEVGAAINPAYEATLRGMTLALSAARDAYARHDAVEALRGQADSAIPELIDTVDALRVSLAAEKLRAENEADRLRARLRETAQILIEEIEADGPMDAEDAARKAVERMNRLRELADEKAHEAGVYALRMEQAQKARHKASEKGTGDPATARAEAIEAAAERGALIERRDVVSYLFNEAERRYAYGNKPGGIVYIPAQSFKVMIDEITAGDHRLDRRALRSPLNDDPRWEYVSPFDRAICERDALLARAKKAEAELAQLRGEGG